MAVIPIRALSVLIFLQYLLSYRRFADDEAVVSGAQKSLQQLMDDLK